MDSTANFAYLVKSCMSPRTCHPAPTTVSSGMMGWQIRIWSIETGNIADIIAVSGDPLKDILELER